MDCILIVMYCQYVYSNKHTYIYTMRLKHLIWGLFQESGSAVDLVDIEVVVNPHIKEHGVVILYC